MAGIITNDVRDVLMSTFRERICETLEVAPFLHQREVWAASDGYTLTGVEDPNGFSVRLENGQIIKVGVIPRPEGRARFLADLGAFKIGKSYGAALWAAGFGAVPGAKISLVGLEYNICEPEFSYICEFLLSARGMGLKAKAHTNRPRQGDMYLELENGATFECRSWERKESLKGREIDGYIFCEAYQLPGIECFTSFSQNLRARRGYAYFATTPDRPWIKLLHELGHGVDPEWHCTCSVPAEANPLTFDRKAKARDVKLMTKEKYEIHYNGQLGNFVGRVFNYQHGQRQFTCGTHPALFRDPTAGANPSNFKLPEGWELVGGADTGTFYTGLVVAFSPDGDAYVLDEFPNYRYVAGSAERDEDITIPQWTRTVKASCAAVGMRPVFWADPNTQFKAEMRNYQLTLLSEHSSRESRTEVAREYFQHRRIYLAPWLQILPFELENASWPDETTAAGRFERVKDRDHTLDCLEHVLVRRPMGRHIFQDRPKSWAESAGLRRIVKSGNVHLGIA